MIVGVLGCPGDELVRNKLPDCRYTEFFSV